MQLHAEEQDEVDRAKIALYGHNARMAGEIPPATTASKQENGSLILGKTANGTRQGSPSP